MHTETKQEKDKGAQAWHVLMMSQSTKEGGTGIYKKGFQGIMREAQLGITPTCCRVSKYFLAILENFSCCLSGGVDDINC